MDNNVVEGVVASGVIGAGIIIGGIAINKLIKKSSELSSMFNAAVKNVQADVPGASIHCDFNYVPETNKNNGSKALPCIFAAAIAGSVYVYYNNHYAEERNAKDYKVKVDKKIDALLEQKKIEDVNVPSSEAVARLVHAYNEKNNIGDAKFNQVISGDNLRMFFECYKDAVAISYIEAIPVNSNYKMIDFDAINAKFKERAIWHVDSSCSYFLGPRSKSISNHASLVFDDFVSEIKLVPVPVVKGGDVMKTDTSVDFDISLK